VLLDDGRPRRFADRVLARVDGAVERLCVNRAAAVLTVSDGLADLMSERFGRSAIVVRNAHDDRLDRPPAHGIRDAANVSKDDFLLAVMGNWKRGMAMESALAALKRLPGSVHIAWVGAGYEHWREVANGLGAGDRAHFLPPVLPVEVCGFVAGADVAPILYCPVTPSHRSAMPNGFFHAIAAGLPILYPRDLPELAATAERYGLGRSIDPADPDDIAATVTALLESRSDLDEIRARVRAAWTELSWEGEETRLAALAGSLGLGTS
jgi:glycosyltransferase involved in cell wall biosynthesis